MTAPDFPPAFTDARDLAPESLYAIAEAAALFEAASLGLHAAGKRTMEEYHATRRVYDDARHALLGAVRGARRKP